MSLDLDVQVFILNNHLRQLAKFRAETDEFYNALVFEAEQARRKVESSEKEMLKAADAVGFVLECFVGVAALAQISGKAVKSTGLLLKKANEEFMERFAKEGGSKLLGIGGMIFDPSNRALEIAINGMSLTYWFNRGVTKLVKYATGDPAEIFIKMVKGFEDDRVRTLTMIDDDILNASERLRQALAGVDDTTIA